ncbi:unnamed protein product, partial [Closterium sp. NIES-54]
KASPENSGIAERGADAPGLEAKQSAVSTEKPADIPWTGDQQQQQLPGEAGMSSQQQQQLLLDQQVTHHRLTMLPDHVLVPPVSPLVDPLPQQHERKGCLGPALALLPPALPRLDYVSRQHELESENYPDPVSQQQQHVENDVSGVPGPSGVARFWPPIVQLQNDNHGTTYTTPTRSRGLGFDLNFSPSDNEEP